MKTLHELATQYAQKNFPIEGIISADVVKHDVAYHSFCDGFNEAMRILMQIGGQKDLDKRISPFNFIDIESDENNK